MDTVTYPDHRVAEFIDRHFLPVRIVLREHPETAEAYLVSWTPNVVITDAQGKVHYRIEGYLPPDDFVARLALGLGKYLLDGKQFAQAAKHFDEVAQRHAGTDMGAEALFWLGVSRFKETHDPAQLRPSWQRLAQEYPHSDWTKRSKIPTKN